MKITIYHKGVDPQNRLPVYEKQDYECTLHVDNRANVTENGLVHKNLYQIRIFTAEEVAVSEGDSVVIGGAEEERPPKGAAVVLSWSDNRNIRLPRGVWHWRVECA